MSIRKNCGHYSLSWRGDRRHEAVYKAQLVYRPHSERRVSAVAELNRLNTKIRELEQELDDLLPKS